MKKSNKNESKYKITIGKFFKHLHTVNKHRFKVFVLCCKAGQPWRGLLHDLSKYSPTEFFEGVKYYQGTYSPIKNRKMEVGYSEAWLHHFGRNKHHYEYWRDGDKGIKMPFKYACELICDYLAAGEIYMGDNFSYQAEYVWWIHKRENLFQIHPHTRQFIEDVLFQLTIVNNKYSVLNKKNLKEIYNKIRR